MKAVKNTLVESVKTIEPVDNRTYCDDHTHWDGWGGEPNKGTVSYHETPRIPHDGTDTEEKK